MKLNIGCGYRKLDGFVNVDRAVQAHPDVVWDIEQLPWPWGTETIEEIRAVHSLEHVGQTTALFIGIMKEAWRVLQCGGIFSIVFPDVHHDNWWSDPTHVRPLTVRTFLLFSQKMTQEWQGENLRNSVDPDIDFELIEANAVLDQAWAHLDRRDPETLKLMVHQNNVVSEWHVKLRKIGID